MDGENIICVNYCFIRLVYKSYFYTIINFIKEQHIINILKEPLMGVEETKKMEKKKLTKIGAGILSALLLAGGGLAVGAASVEPVEVPMPYNVTVTEYVNVEVEVPGPEVEKIVYQDNDNLGIVMDFVQDEIDEDIDVDYIVFEMESKIAAEAWINNHFINWLQDEDYFDNGELFDDYRKSEVSIKKIYDAEIVDRDIEDKDLVLAYEVKLRAKESGEDREYFKFLIELPFEDGEFEDEDIDVELLEE